jgi:hypothetical protein
VLLEIEDAAPSAAGAGEEAAPEEAR